MSVPSLIGSLGMVVCLITAFLISRKATASANAIIRSRRWYVVALGFAILGVAADAPDPDLITLVDVASVAAVSLTLVYLNKRLRARRTTEHIRALHAARQHGLPWPTAEEESKA